MLKHTYLEREQGVLLKENAVNLGNTEMQILTRPVPATTIKALGVNPGAFVYTEFL